MLLAKAESCDTQEASPIMRLSKYVNTLYQPLMVPENGRKGQR